MRSRRWGGKLLLVYFYHVYLIFVVGFFLWKDTDFLFVADTKYPSSVIVFEKKVNLRKHKGNIVQSANKQNS